LLIVVPWFIAAEWRNPGFLRFFMIHEHLQRFLTDTEHGWGPWFFIPIVIAGTWPWLFFAPSGVAALREQVDDAPERGALRFLLIWFAVVFLFFSIPRSKLGEYILPGLPPIAILAGVGLARVRDVERGRARVLGWYAAVNVAVVLIAIIGVIAVSRGAGSGMELPSGGGLLLELLLAGLVLAVSACSIWLYVRRSGDGRAVPLGIGLTALLLAGVITRARGAATPYFSYRNLARATAPYLEQGCGLASYHHFVQALPFYTRSRERLVGYRGELSPFSDSPDAAPGFVATDSRLLALWAAPSCTIIVVNSADWPRLAATLRPASRIGCEGKKIAMINRAGANLPGLPPACQASTSAPRP
jgi:4-amino-4-deoxy-L-arabinose transferase-like glycosyltransferase